MIRERHRDAVRVAEHIALLPSPGSLSRLQGFTVRYAGEGFAVVRCETHVQGTQHGAAPQSSQASTEIKALADEFCPTWCAAQARRRCIEGVVAGRRYCEGPATGAGDTSVDSRYRSKNSTVIERLAISPMEGGEMRTIISSSKARRRYADRETAARRALGVQTSEMSVRVGSSYEPARGCRGLRASASVPLQRSLVFRSEQFMRTAWATVRVASPHLRGWRTSFLAVGPLARLLLRGFADNEWVADLTSRAGRMMKTPALKALRVGTRARADVRSNGRRPVQPSLVTVDGRSATGAPTLLTLLGGGDMVRREIR